MFEVKKKSEVVGMYLPEGELIYSNTRLVVAKEGYDKFLPVMSGFSRVMNKDFTLVNVMNREESVDTYNRNMVRSSLSNEKLRSSMIDISRSDLSFDSDIILLNFTDSKVTVNNDKALRKVFPKIENNKLVEFEGKLVIMEINSLNTVDFIANFDGTSDYLSSLIDDLKANPNMAPDIYSKTLDIYLNAKEFYDGIILEKKKFDANSIKIVNILELDGEYIHKLDKGETLLIPEYRIVLSREKINNICMNPYTSKDMALTIKELETINRNNLTAYINDPKNYMSPKYMFVGGEAIEIPKVVIPGEDPKLVIRIVENGEEVKVKEHSFEEIPNLDFIFNNRQEAIDGMDRIQKAERELKEVKIQHERDLSNIKREYEEKRERRADEKEIRNLKMEEELRVINLQKEALENDRDLLRAEMEKQRELLKLETMKYQNQSSRENENMKFHYDMQRSDKDATIQTLKVVGGCVALGVAVYAAWKKLS